MRREENILGAIDDLDGFDFQKLACRLLKRELFPNLNSLPDQDDLGQDARTEGLPVTEFPSVDGEDITFAISKTNTKSKLKKDCDRCREVGHDIETFVFVTFGEVKNARQKEWKQHVRDEYGWELVIYERTWFADVVTQPEHEKLIEEILGIPPLNGDYYADIVETFKRETEKTLKRVSTKIPLIDQQLSRSEVSDIHTKLTAGDGVLVTGEGGVGKSGVLAQLLKQWSDIPVLFIDARRFSECSTTTELRQAFDFNGPLSDAVARLGRHNSCLVIVDQLDNIGGTPAAKIFTELLTEVSDVDGVHTAAACRSWDLENQRVFKSLSDDDRFTTVKVSGLSRPQVRDTLSDLGITDYSDEILTLGQNLLNLSIIAELKIRAESSQIDFTAIRAQVELWDHYQETLVERETQGGEWDERSGDEVRARAIELAQTGLRDGSRVFPISLRRERPDKRLISRDVIVKEVGERYRFRHEELQDYFYAWNAVNRRGWTTPQEVLGEIDERVAAGVFRWMIQILLKRDGGAVKEFLDATLSDEDLGYYAATRILDEIASWDPEDVEDDVVDVALSQIDSNEQYREYFYTNLKSAAWVETLQDRGRFDDPCTPVMVYLQQIGTEVPDLTVEIIQNTGADQDHFRAAFVKTAGELPTEQATQCVDVFTDWLSAADAEIDPYTVNYHNFLEKMVAENAIDSALSLLSALTNPQPPDPEIIQRDLPHRETWNHRMQTEATAVTRVHTIERAIETVVADLPEEYTKEIIDLLESNLRKAIRIEAQEMDADPDDLSWPLYAGGSDLHNTKLKEVLLDELQSSIEEWIATEPSAADRRALLDRYLNDFRLFRRLGLYLLSQNADAFPELIREGLLAKDNYDDYSIKQEFFQLLQNGYRVLSTSEQGRILDIIDESPDRAELVEKAEAREERFPDRDINDVVDEEIDLWQLRRLWMIRDHLSGDRVDRLEQLVETYGEPDHLEGERSARMGAVSFEGPMDFEKLRELDANEIFKLCVNWDPDETDANTDFHTEVSPRGLAEDIKELIAESPGEFTPHLSILSDADSIYIAYGLDGLRDALDADRDFEWGPVLNLCQETTTRDDAQASSSRKHACRLLSEGLSQEKTNLLEHQNAVRDCLLTLANDSEPELKDEDHEYLNHDRPLQVAINAVRPLAVDTIIKYAVERAKAAGYNGYDEEEEESGIESTVRRCLIRKMDDPSTAVHCVFGKRLRNLLWLDRELVENNLDILLPMEEDSESRDRFSAAWAAYLSVSPWVKGLYYDLKDQYFHSIELHGAEDRFTGNTEGNSFVAHALCSYIHTDETLRSSDSLLPYFYENTTPDTAGSAAWQLWRWADQEPEFRERWPDIRALWEWRLDKSSDDHEAHSKEFGWFVEWLDLIPEEVEPTTIKSMLQRTTPILVYNRRGWKTLEAYLARWVDNIPHCCIEIYAKLLRQPQIPDYMEFEDEAKTILETALQAGGDTRDLAFEVTEMVAEYDQTFLQLLQEYSVD